MTEPSPDVVVLTCEYPPFSGGIATYCENIVRGLEARGRRVTVIAPRYEDAPLSAGNVRRLLDHHGFSPASVLAVLAELRRAPRALLHASDIRSVMLAWLNRLLGGQPYQAMIHGSEVSKFRGPTLLKAIVARAYGAADLICANSHATMDTYVANFGAPKKAVVAWLGVDEAWFVPAGDSFEHPALAAIPGETPIVSTVGRIEDRKGHVEAIRAIDLARKAGMPDVVYVAAGPTIDPAYKALAEATAKDLGVQLIFPGRVSESDIRTLFRRSRVHLLCATPLPTKVEGFGFVILEAAAQGCPSVCTAVGGIPEVVGRDEGSVVRDPGDIDGLAEELRRLVVDPVLRDAAGRAAQARARTFTWSRCVEQSFADLLARPRP